MTAPVSAWLVSTRIAESAAGTSCSGRWIRSKYLETGMNASLTLASPRDGVSSCCRTGSGLRDAKTSPGRSRTGTRFTVAAAAPVTMLVAPGPIDVVHASAARRLRILANPAAVCTMAGPDEPCECPDLRTTLVELLRGFHAAVGPSDGISIAASLYLQRHDHPEMLESFRETVTKPCRLKMAGKSSLDFSARTPFDPPAKPPP